MNGLIFGKVQREYLNVMLRLILPTVGFMFIMQSALLARWRTGNLPLVGSYDVSQESLRTLSPTPHGYS
jgi:hypothetical protein